MYVFHEFWTSLRGVLSFSRATSDFLCTVPCTPVVTVIRGLTFNPIVFNI